MLWVSIIGTFNFNGLKLAMQLLKFQYKIS